MSSDTLIGASIVLAGLLASGSAVISGFNGDPRLEVHDALIRIFGGGFIFLVFLLAATLFF